MEEQFVRLGELMTEWNQKINVISRKDMENFYLHHVLHSLGIARVIQFEKQTSILDAGTGGGFPGIPLAILFPEVRFHLVDSIGKKIKVVQEVARELNLTNVRADQSRVEQLRPEYDFVVSRAVTTLAEIYSWTRLLVRKGSRHHLANGILYLKGGNLDEEIKNMGRDVQVFELKKHFSEDFFETKQVVYISC